MGQEQNLNALEDGSAGFGDLQGDLDRALEGARNFIAGEPGNTNEQIERDRDAELTAAAPSSAETEATKSTSRTMALVAVGVFLLAAIPRLANLFLISDPGNPGLGWFNDTFHHWQIAYLSSEIGFSKGFLTLWDFKGVEYFWGLLHPLTLAILFRLTGSIDIIIPRLLSAFTSSASYALLFLLIRRYFNVRVAAAGTLLAVVNPVAIFGDTAGMQEPLGLMLLLGGLLLWPREAVWAGILVGLAGMVRAEYWVFGAGLVVASWLTREDGQRKVGLAIGWALPSAMYMRYLAVKTGNAIYPVYWNFFGTVAGEWMPDRAPTSSEAITQWAARVVFALALAGALWLIWRRRRGMLFLGLGLANILLLSLMWGFSDYVLGFEARVLFGRLVIVPYMYAGVFAAALFFSHLASKPQGNRWRRIGWVLFLAAALGLQLMWKPILDYYNGRADLWTAERNTASEIAGRYRGGAIVIPSGLPGLTYALSRFEEIPALALQSSMYDPFFYMDGTDPFADWETNRREVASWIEKLDIQMLAFDRGNRTYQEMVSREPDWFHPLAINGEAGLEIYAVASP